MSTSKQLRHKNAVAPSSVVPTYPALRPSRSLVSQPARVHALAYTQGADIHLVGPSQEQHLAHEAWHVVQQKRSVQDVPQASINSPAAESTQVEKRPPLRWNFAHIPLFPATSQYHSGPVELSASADQPTSLRKRIDAARGSGQPLKQRTQYILEHELRTDLSAVRIHADAEADRLSRSIDAAAFTIGPDIFFRSGTYHPDSSPGLHLLAHEATHVVQQAAGPVAGIPCPYGIAISNPGDPFELAAEKSASQIMDDTAIRREAETMDVPKEVNQRSYLQRSYPGYDLPFRRGISDAGNYSRQTSRKISPSIHQQSPSTIQRLRIANLASGTDPRTLMAPIPETPYTDVTNFDTGHMAISDVLLENIDQGSLEPFKHDIVNVIGSTEALRQRFQSFREKNPLIQDPTMPFIKTFAQMVLQFFLKDHPDSRGAKEIYNRMRDVDKLRVVERLQGLEGFKLGDASRLPLERPFDEIHMINAYGFDPLNDPNVFIPLAKALNDGGRLIITAEATGPTVAPALGDLTRQDKRDNNWRKNGFPNRIPGLGLLALFEYVSNQSSIGTREAIFAQHRLTQPLDTRHTVGNTNMMEELPTVQLVFIRAPRAFKI